MNDLDPCLELVSRSRQPLRYIILTLNISETVRDRGLIPKDHQWHMGYQVVTWPMTSRDRQRCCKTVRSAILATAWLVLVDLPWRLTAAILPPVSTAQNVLRYRFRLHEMLKIHYIVFIQKSWMLLMHKEGSWTLQHGWCSASFWLPLLRKGCP